MHTSTHLTTRPESNRVRLANVKHLKRLLAARIGKWIWKADDFVIEDESGSWSSEELEHFLFHRELRGSGD